jgi:hypothetical protein
VSKKIDASVLDRKAPEAFLFTASSKPSFTDGSPPTVELRYPVEETVERSAWFRAHYRLHASLPVREDLTLLWYARARSLPGGRRKVSRSRFPV